MNKKKQIHPIHPQTQKANMTTTPLSLYIPRVFIHHTAAFIQDALEKKLGKVSRVDVIPKLDNCGKVYQVAFVHFETWQQDCAYAEEIQKGVANKEAPRFYYKDSYYWILLENQSIRKIPGERKLTLQLEPLHDPLKYTRM